MVCPLDGVLCRGRRRCNTVRARARAHGSRITLRTSVSMRSPVEIVIDPVDSYRCGGSKLRDWIASKTACPTATFAIPADALPRRHLKSLTAVIRMGVVPIVRRDDDWATFCLVDATVGGGFVLTLRAVRNTELEHGVKRAFETETVCRRCRLVCLVRQVCHVIDV